MSHKLTTFFRSRHLPLVIGCGLPLTLCLIAIAAFYAIVSDSSPDTWLPEMYPSTRSVYLTNAYGYWGAGRGFAAKYYWTQDNIEVVKAYFESRNASFINDRFWGYPLAAFNIQEISQSDFARTYSGRCDPVQTRDCINLWLVEVNEEGLSTLPHVIGFSASSAANATPDYVGTFEAGTLLIYQYSVNDF